MKIQFNHFAVWLDTCGAVVLARSNKTHKFLKLSDAKELVRQIANVANTLEGVEYPILAGQA